MIPILYDKNETAFVSNGLCRLRDCISCVVTEERNGIYECDFTYPINGANFDYIECGRIIGVTHDDTKMIQPFDIVSYSKPIDGIVSFHCVHISYRQSGLTVSGKNINSLADAFTLLGNSSPANPFTYETDMTSSNYMASADGVPRSVRQLLGGIEGSILDTYGGEYEWDVWKVILHSQRGQFRNFSIRYGVNMLDFTDEADFLPTYNACIPYWTGQDNGKDVVVKASKVSSGFTSYRGDEICVPLDLTDKFETKPTTTQLTNMARSIMQSKQVNLPNQTVKVDFIRLQDYDEGFTSLMQCNLCDSINVIFPSYKTQATFKIVKTEWDVLMGRYNSMELGNLSTSLAEALGLSDRPDNFSKMDDYIIDQDTSTTQTGVWHWRKWASGKRECWGKFVDNTPLNNSAVGGYASGYVTPTDFPTDFFTQVPHVICTVYAGTVVCWAINGGAPSTTNVGSWRAFRLTSSGNTGNRVFNFYCIGI